MEQVDREVKAAAEVIAANVTTEDDHQQDFCLRVAREALDAAKKTRPHIVIHERQPSGHFSGRFEDDHFPR